MTFEVLVERHAVAEQILDALACLACEQQRNFLIDDSGPGDDRVGRMVFGAVALGKRGGDAALRPQARRAFAEMRG